MRICPICGKEYKEKPAISRTDNKTEICPICGVVEALDAAGVDNVTKETIIATIQSKKD